MKNLAVLLVSFLLASCATPRSLIGGVPAPDPTLESRLERAADQSEVGRAVRDGGKALLNGDSPTAVKAFSRAVKLDPNNPQFHLLSAIAYHLGYSKGHQINRDLAETGYLVSLRMDPNNIIAAEMLGQLYMDTGRYSDARQWLGRALLLGESSARVYHSFAVASYYSQDLPLALWAIANAELIEEKSSPVVRASALIRAATGQFAAADERVRRYDEVEPDVFLRRSLTQRVAQWRTALETRQIVENPVSAHRPGTQLLAQAGSPPPLAPVPIVSNGPLAPSWSDCAQTTQPVPFGGNAVQQPDPSDETAQLPPLPSPCAGRPLPRMAVIDVAIIRSTDTASTTKGVNLLQSLNVTLGASLLAYQRNYTVDNLNAATGTPPGLAVDTRTVNRGLTAGLTNVFPLPTTVGAIAALNYSLNIANATDQANEVIARPSLLTLDRQPSTFFSGTKLTATVSNGLTGSSSIQNLPTGVSLSVTPTFIDDDSMLLAVKAARSFLQDPNSADLRLTVQSTRNVASANVRIRFNETLALSGLSEREMQENETGVPILKDIPLLQYLFKNETTLNFNHAIMVLVTPRRPESNGTGSQPAAASREPAEVAEMRTRAYKGWNMIPNLDVTMAQLNTRHLDHVDMLRAVRTGDLKAQIWVRPDGVKRILTEIADFLYY